MESEKCGLGGFRRGAIFQDTDTAHFALNRNQNSEIDFGIDL
jgi:hypothetical protein